MAEDEWVLLTSDEKDAYINMVLGSSVSLTALPVKEPENEPQEESIMDVLNVNEDDEDERVSVSGLSMLAKAYSINQPNATVEGIYEKSVELLGKNGAVVLAPGCDKKARPHLVTPGKQKGEYRCEKKTVRILMAYEFAPILL